MNEDLYDTDCSACEIAQEDYAALELVADDLSALVQRLARALRKAAPDNDLPERALDYLRRKNLQGSPLRDADSAPSDQHDRLYAAVPDGWKRVPVDPTIDSVISGYKPWVAKHLKTGNEYLVIGEALDATNMYRGMHMIIYQRDGKTFTREASEFTSKFAAMQKGGA